MDSKKMDNEESILQSLFLHFSKFNYDKAKELAERERDARVSGCSLLWPSVLTCVAQLASVEKLYMNLHFLTSKGFLRKESSVRASYEALNSELSDLGAPRRSAAPNNNNGGSSMGGGCSGETSDGILRHICTQLVYFIKARLLLINFYEKLVEASQNRLMNFEQLVGQLTDISAINSSNFHHPILTPVKTNFTLECDILIHLLRSEISMSSWVFLPSLLHLNDAHYKLNTWHHTYIQPKEPKKYGFGAGFLKSSPLPLLYQWLWQTKAALVSKFSLYFHETLAAQSSPSEMKTLISKQPQACDYVSKIQSFQRKSDAACICIVLEAGDGYIGPGYHYPVKQQHQHDNVTGINTFPHIFAYPHGKPLDRWPGIIMRVKDRNTENVQLDRVVHFYDQQIGCTYFLIKIEGKITLVVLFDGNKSQKDCYIKDFMYDLTLQLRSNKLFANLKPK